MVVGVEQGVGAAVPDSRGRRCGVDDVGWEDRGEHPVRFGWLAGAGQEFLDLGQRRFSVALPLEVVAGLLEVADV